MTLELALGAGLLGAIVGSFAATLCLRWPKGEGVVAGRSRCDGCGRALRASELVPVLSAVASGHRCRSCGARIAAFHTQVEMAAAAIGVIALAAAPTFAGAALALLGWLLLPLVLLDARHLWLPDRLVLLLAGAGLLAGGYMAGTALSDRMIGGAAGVASLWLVAAAYRRLRNREGLGAGDPKLFGALGLWLGWAALPAVLLLAALIGLGWALADRRTTMSSALPLGTLLGVAGWLVALTQAVRAVP